MKRIISILFSISIILVSYGQSSLQQFLNNPSLKHASVGVCVKDLSTGSTIVSCNEDKSLTTASVMKLLTTATALELLGPKYRYETRLALDANDPSKLLVIGSGDPTLGTSMFKENQYTFLMDWSDKLKTKLGNSDNLKIYVVDNLFGYNGVSDEWTWIDMGNYYAAGSYGISVFDNTYRLYFNTTDRNRSPKILRTEPEVKGLIFTNYLKLNTTGRDNGYIYGAPFSYNRVLRGDIPAGRTAFSIKGDIPDPGLMLGQVLASELGKRGIRVAEIETAHFDYINNANNASRAKNTNYRVGEVLHVHQSRQLTDILGEVNVESNNHYAEHLIRTIGRNQSLDIYSDALEEGIKYVNKHWAERGISTSSLFMHDGCGLAPQNAASAELLCDLLVYMHNRSDYGKEFFASLPLSGRDGTLKNFMNNTKYRGKVRAKSGSIGGVQCYAGYLIDGNKRYAFTIMVNKFTGSRSAVRKNIEQFIESL